MTRTSLVLDDHSLNTLRRIAARLEISQSEVVRRSLQDLDLRQLKALTPAQALDALAKQSAGPRKLATAVRQQRAQRRAADQGRA